MAHLSIDVLGLLQISIADTPIRTLESVKARALLAYLAVESDRPHRRESLVGLLWPDYPEEAARHNLRQALFNLRQAIRDKTAQPTYLLTTRDTIQFNQKSDFSLDFDQFNRQYSSFEDKLSQFNEDSLIDASQLEELVKLYRGDFLQKFILDDSTEFEEWAVVQRENLHQRVLEVHRYLASLYTLRQDFQAARRHASRQLELDPWREEAHRQMMRVLALDGQRSAALAQYDTCKRVLAEELFAEPSAETRELYEQIRLGTLRHKTDQQPTLPAIPLNNLPVQLTPFIGREHELDQLGRLIADPECRCISLVGPGGIGKTRLAVQAAGDNNSEFAHGVAFVPLASVGSMMGVIPAIAKAISYAIYGPGDPKEQLLSYLREKQMLLVLDNVEQLIFGSTHKENIAQLIIEILQQAPGLKLLVTTRQALNLQEEWLFEVQGLAVPETVQTEGFEEFDAVALFVQRARRAAPMFVLSKENRSEVAQICCLVEGMPLAIELAATWIRTLSPAEIAVEIKNNLDFLSASMRDLPERHRSMRVVFDYSWQMLSADEQLVLSKLSVFRGGFHRQAADQVAGATLSILSTLLNRTLLRRTTAGRYDVHELIRQFCAAQLAMDPQLKIETQRLHYTYYLTLAETAEQELKGGCQIEWLIRLEQEHDNLREAFEWALLNDGNTPSGEELGLKLSAAMRWFWRMRGYFHEGCAWLKEALQRSPEIRSAARARALSGLALLINALGDLGAARAPIEESVDICRELNDQRNLAEALMIDGLNSIWQGESSMSHQRTREALAIYRNVGDRWGEAHALYRLGSYLADYSGDSTGRILLEESAAIAEDLGDKYLLTSALISLGIVDLSKGDYSIAQQRFERCLDVTREIRYPWGIADALTNLGCLYRIKGEYANAQPFFNEALQVYQEHMRNVWGTDVLCAMTENALVQGDFPTAHIHLQAANNLLGSSENKWLQALIRYFAGSLAYYEGDAEEAAVMLGETTVLAREGQFMPDLARSLVALGRVRLKLGEIGLANDLMIEGLGLFRNFGHKLGMANALEALADVSLVRGDAPHAVMLCSTSNSIRQTIGAPLPPIDRPAYDHTILTCRNQLGDDVFNDLWDRAATKTYKEIVEETLKVGEAISGEVSENNK